jgi:NADPH-dependent ferric siderophore reductase
LIGRLNELYLDLMQTATSARRSGGRLRDLFSVTGTVTQLDPITRRMLRIRIEGDDLAGLACLPGQQVRVHVAGLRWLHPRDMLRSYSVWQHDDTGIELCVLNHDTGGPGAQWARQLRTGDPVSFGKPEGSFVLREGAYQVFAGEETAAVAFGAMLRALPPATPVYGILEVDELGDRLPLGLPLGHQLTWQYREGRSAAASQPLLETFTRLRLPPEPGVAYLAGEARTIQLLRRHLVSERGWPREAVRTKPFWAPGKRGLD